jgi:hypothetical protein
MPGFDRSGPMGAGPMTGGGRGFCNRTAAAGMDQPYRRGRGFGRGLRAGLGGRRGFRDGAGYPADAAAGRVADTDEVRYLRASVEELKSTVGRIEQRLSELNTNTSD